MGAPQMSKHSANQGPNRSNRLRSLVTFRHQNPAARAVSITAAFAMATLLVVGTGAAYADDTAPPSAPAPTAPGDGSTPPADTTSAGDTTAPDTSTPSAASPASDPASAPASEPAAPTP